jgi:hypothetical protein
MSMPSAFACTDDFLLRLRTKGWMVAVHNDYILKGKKMTFWLFTHPDGRYVRGEAETDVEALRQIVVNPVYLSKKKSKKS